MAGMMSSSLGKVKQEWASLLSSEHVLAACRAVGHRWRKRQYGPIETVQLFLLQVLHGNRALTHLSHLWGSFVNDSAFCEARKRLPLAVWHWLLKSVGQKFRDSTETLWHGLRVWMVDGSSFSMPDQPELARHFGYPANQRKGCGFPVAHLLALMDVATGLVRQAHALPLNRHDMPHMPTLHTLLGAGDLLVAARGFCSYAHLAVLQQRQVHAVFRVHASQRIDFTPGRGYSSWQIRRKARKASRAPRRSRTRRARQLPPTSKWIKSFGPSDQIVMWFKSKERPAWLSPEEYAALPDELLVRELRYRVGKPGFRVQSVTLVTTLLDPESFPATELQELYARRWRIETNFRHLKTTMRLDVLKCKTVEGVCKELAVFALVYNMVRAVMHVAASARNVPTDRVSFVDALRWLASGARTPLESIVINPDRPNRYEPRVRKRRSKPYPLMRKPRKTLRKELSANML
jgi:Transposase DDE domain